jgi:hypothetical protein
MVYFSKMAQLHGLFSHEIFTNGNIAMTSILKIPIHLQNFSPCFGQNYTAGSW